MSRRPDFFYFSDAQLEELLIPLKHSLKKPVELARAVKKLSDFYIQNPEGKTPWRDPDVQVAYLVYYLPLGIMRWRSLFDEALRWNFLEGLDQLVDFGSGPGTATFVFQEAFARGNVTAVDSAREASGFHRTLFQKWPRVKPTAIQTVTANVIPKPTAQLKSRSLLLLSYVLTEHDSPPPEILLYDSVIVAEPSTHQDGRRLMEWREMWMRDGYHMWAPCTHQHACPLLHQSKKDWCHDRVTWTRPEWWLEMEKNLPFKNNSITFSYLMMSRRKPPQHPTTLARLVGDRLPEKGKVRQMMCRGPEREFLSWLEKAGAPPDYSRGEILELENSEVKGAEVRAKTRIWT